ncbi:ABC transporter ATP-binding protein [Nonomuraea sp. NPDC046570]|uniref:ABC transporter ATP-binding protein n=1 Tax=Nonomuraea sp. NPDC046570 TaxID=3155255 RepID=UPI0033D818CD
MSTITVSRLSKSFGAVQAVHDLSFTVEPGTIAGFLGPNGAGKTTTLRMLLGLVKPSSGTALIHDRRYADLASPITQVGAVLEATAFHPGRTARVHLHVLCKAARLPLSRADEVLEEVEMTSAADRRVGGFSLGMRQRLALASALLGSPRTLILDEPANGLDPEGIHWMRAFIRSYATSGRTVLVSSHVLAEIEQVVDHVVIIRSGRLVWEGTLGELTAGRTLEDAYLHLTREAQS